MAFYKKDERKKIVEPSRQSNENKRKPITAPNTLYNVFLAVVALTYFVFKLIYNNFVLLLLVGLSIWYIWIIRNHH